MRCIAKLVQEVVFQGVFRREYAISDIQAPVMLCLWQSESRISHALFDALSPFDVFDGVLPLPEHSLQCFDDLKEAACCAFVLSEANNTETALATLFEYCKHLCVEAHRLEM